MINFRRTTIILLVLSWLSLANAVASTDSSVLAELPIEARQSVIKWNHKFKPYASSDFSSEVNELFTSDLKKVAPMKLVADFNGDKVEDYAILGESEKQQYLIAVLSDKKDPKVVIVEKWSDPEFKKTSVAYYLTRAAGSLPESYAKKNNREAIQLEAYLGAVQLFKIENGKASELKP